MLSALSVVAEGVRVRVLTTFLPLTAHALAIAGPDADVEQMLSQGVGAHDYQLRPGDARRVASADLVVLNGLGLDAWLEPLLQQVGGKNLRVVNTSVGLETEANSATLRWRADGASRHEEHACAACASDAQVDASGNPHVWLDPVMARHQARAIAEALIAADPARAGGYRARLGAYDAELEGLETRMRSVLEPVRGASLVTLHDAFPYFARRFGLSLAGSLEPFPGREPSPRELAGLITLIRTAGVQVIFTERGYSPRLIQSVAREAGVRLAELDTLEVGTPSATAYLEGMEANARAVATALAGAAPRAVTVASGR